MNLQLILKGFIQYLEEQNLITEEEYQQQETNVDISIFAYASEFKRYLKDEMNIFQDVSSLDFEQLLSMEVSEGQLQLSEEELLESENPEEILGEENQNSELSKDALIEIINNLLQDEEIISAFDKSGDGALDKEEIAEFLNSLNEEDDITSELSLAEVFDRLDQIKKEKEGIIEEETLHLEEEVEENPVEVEQEVLEGRKTPSSSYYSGPSSSPSSSGGKGSPDGKQSLENMSKEQLQSELTTAQGEVSEKEETLSGILDGSNSQIQAQNQAVETAYQTYQEQLKLIDEDLAKRVDDKVQEISAKESEISAKKLEVSTQEGVISQSETAFKNATANREQLESSLASLNSTDTSNMDESQKSDLASKISQLEAKIPGAKDAETAAETKLNEDKEQLETLKTQQEELETQLEELQAQKTELDEEVRELENTELTSALEAYNTAKSDCDTLKNKLESSAKTELQNAQNRVSEIQAAINVKENEEVKKEYSMSLYDPQKGEDLVKAARTMLERYGSSTGYCATGVSRTMSIAYGISMGGHGYQWDTNMEQLVEKGMFVEVTSDYPSADLLSTLPAGAVVCWENTATSGGGGKQYGHVCIADGNGGEISDHYQSNIYKSVGGRSDQYRIFIPV